MARTIHHHYYTEARKFKRLVNKGLKALADREKKATAALRKFHEERLGLARQQRVEADVDLLLKAGQLTPREVDRRDPSNVFDELLLLDATTPVLRGFSENGVRRDLTRYDIKIRQLKQRRGFPFGEQLQDRDSTPPGENGEEVIRAVVRKFSENFRAMGASEESVIAEYRAFPPNIQKQRVKEYREMLQRPA